jgi:hypothetical protein
MELVRVFIEFMIDDHSLIARTLNEPQSPFVFDEAIDDFLPRRRTHVRFVFRARPFGETLGDDHELCRYGSSLFLFLLADLIISIAARMILSSESVARPSCKTTNDRWRTGPPTTVERGDLIALTMAGQPPCRLLLV